MTADFKEVYWLLEHNFQLTNTDRHCYYVLTIGQKCVYVRKLDPTDTQRYFNNQYICHINKVTGRGNVLFSSFIDFGSKEWITDTGETPKQAIRNAMNLALLDPNVQHKEDVKSINIVLNPVLWFFRNIINYIKNR